MKKRNIILIYASAIIFLASYSTFAGNRPGAVTITGSEAYYHFSTKRDLNGNSMPNMAFAFNLANAWAIEATTGLINSGRLRNYPLKESKAGVHGYLFMLDGLYRFSPFLGYEPYIAAGVGLLNLKPTDYSTQQGNINAAIGSQYFLGHSVALRLEVRDIYTPSGAKNDYMVNLGLSLLFGGRGQQCCEQTTTSKGELFYKDKLI